MQPVLTTTRRHFLGQAVSCLGAVALQALSAAETRRGPHYPARAKRVIFMHMAGGPSQLELFEHKPELRARDGQPCPESLLAGRRFAFIRGTPDLLGPQAAFAQH